jgi:hypothetical protein
VWSLREVGKRLAEGFVIFAEKKCPSATPVVNVDLPSVRDALRKIQKGFSVPVL